MKVLCVGFGFVGKAYALLLRELGHKVYVKTAEDSTLRTAKNYGFEASSDLCNLIEGVHIFDAVVIAVPTPTNKGEQDISILEDVLKEVYSFCKTKSIIIKSTVIPKNLKKLEKKYKKHNQTFYAYPEFLEAKNPIGGVFNQKCCAFGKTGRWRKKEKKFISRLFGLPLDRITFTTMDTACMLKYIHNIWLSCNLSFWNSVMRCMKYSDADFNKILEETHKSEYFGRHPWHIGTAYGGVCLPKDIKAFIDAIDKNSVYKKFIEAIDEVNEKVKEENSNA